MDHAKQSDLISKFYFDATSTIRHYDGQRADYIRQSIAIISALFGLVGILVKIGNAETSLLSIRFVLLFIILLSVLFLIISIKFNYLINRQRTRAIECLKELSKRGFDDALLIDSNAKVKIRDRHRLFSVIPFHFLVSAIYLAFLVFAASLLLILDLP